MEIRTTAPFPTRREAFVFAAPFRSPGAFSPFREGGKEEHARRCALCGGAVRAAISYLAGGALYGSPLRGDGGQGSSEGAKHPGVALFPALAACILARPLFCRCIAATPPIARGGRIRTPCRKRKIFPIPPCGGGALSLGKFKAIWKSVLLRGGAALS